MLLIDHVYYYYYYYYCCYAHCIAYATTAKTIQFHSLLSCYYSDLHPFLIPSSSRHFQHVISDCNFTQLLIALSHWLITYLHLPI